MLRWILLLFFFNIIDSDASKWKFKTNFVIGIIVLILNFLIGTVPLLTILLNQHCKCKYYQKTFKYFHTADMIALVLTIYIKSPEIKMDSLMGVHYIRIIHGLFDLSKSHDQGAIEIQMLKQYI